MDQESPAPVDISPTESAVEPSATNQFPAAARIFDRFLNDLGAFASAQLCLPVELRPASGAQSTLAAALGSNERDTCIVTLGIAPRSGFAYLIFGSAFLGAALEILLGAPSTFASQPRGFLTELDLHVVDDFLETAVGELRNAWNSVSNASFSRISTRLGGGVVLAEIDDTPVVVLSAEICVNGRVDRLRLILPSLLARMAGQSSNQAVPDEEGRDQLLYALSCATVEVEAVVKASKIRFRDVLRLRTGMVLALPYKSGTPLECRVNGIAKFRGEMIRGESGVAMQVQQLISDGAQPRGVHDGPAR